MSTTTVRERPIIFSAPMVKAILADQKSQTRRIVKPQPPCECAYVINGAHSHALCYHEPTAPGGKWTTQTVIVPPTPRSKDNRLPCPYGKPGDRLWVREKFRLASGWIGWMVHSSGINGLPIYAADYPQEDVEEDARNYGWRSPIYMPRWASRLTLEVTGVRVERVQDISEDDAKAESFAETRERVGNSVHWSSARGHFAGLWDTINGKGSWESNPWVWVVAFKRLEAPHA